MKIITFAAIKGGVGKTTLAFNFGEYLASEGKNVLFIDLDHQSNLSQIYDVYDTENTVGNIFNSKGDVTLHEVGENISLISGDLRLDEIERGIENKSNKNMLLYMWLSDNYEPLDLARFDFIIIDTHPDFSTATKNAIIVSDLIISPLTPSEHGYNAKFNLQERIKEFKQEAIDYTSRQSFVTAKLFFIGNMIKHNTKSSRELLEVLEKDSMVIANIPEKELFNRSTLDKKSLAKMTKDKKVYNANQEFFDNMGNIFKTISENA